MISCPAKRLSIVEGRPKTVESVPTHSTNSEYSIVRRVKEPAILLNMILQLVKLSFFPFPTRFEISEAHSTFWKFLNRSFHLHLGVIINFRPEIIISKLFEGMMVMIS
jgi:hypothetical protein